MVDNRQVPKYSCLSREEVYFVGKIPSKLEKYVKVPIRWKSVSYGKLLLCIYTQLFKVNSSIVAVLQENGNTYMTLSRDRGEACILFSSLS